MYPYVVSMLLVGVRMYPYVTRMYPYVSICYSYVTRMYPCGVLVKIVRGYFRRWEHVLVTVAVVESCREV